MLSVFSLSESRLRVWTSKEAGLYYKELKKKKKKTIFHKTKQGYVEIQNAQETHECVWHNFSAKELPDEIDVIVEASAETPGRHLV